MFLLILEHESRVYWLVNYLLMEFGKKYSHHIFSINSYSHSCLCLQRVQVSQMNIPTCSIWGGAKMILRLTNVTAAWWWFIEVVYHWWNENLFFFLTTIHLLLLFPWVNSSQGESHKLPFLAARVQAFDPGCTHPMLAFEILHWKLVTQINRCSRGPCRWGEGQIAHLLRESRTRGSGSTLWFPVWISK